MEFNDILSMNNFNIEDSFYICPNCHKVARFKINGIDTISIDSDLDNLQIGKYNLSIEVLCNNCDQFMFQCDKKLVSIIKLLLGIGIETHYCCEGHIQELYYPFNDGDKHFRIESPYIILSTSNIDIQNAILKILENAKKNLSFIETYIENLSEGKLKITIRSLIHSELIQDELNDPDNSISDKGFVLRKRLNHVFKEFVKILEDIIYKAISIELSSNN